jgi:hypothetical protein|tara:strand:- start:1049 stop:1156 length:108 start_codon:yes stop_codon:yes gene_type:complete
MAEWLTLDVINGIGTSTGFFAGLLIAKEIWIRKNR